MEQKLGKEQQEAIDKLVASGKEVSHDDLIRAVTLQFRVFPDPKSGVVIMEFSEEIKYVGFTTKQARRIAKELRDVAKFLEHNKELREDDNVDDAAPNEGAYDSNGKDV